MRLEWTETADADRERVEAHFGQYNLRAAVAAGDRIEEHVEALLTFPLMGRVGRFHGTREVVVPRSDCVVIYRVSGEVIEILKIIHGGQEWPDAL